MSTLVRAQLLLEPDQHGAPAEMAQQEGWSISELSVWPSQDSPDGRCARGIFRLYWR